MLQNFQTLLCSVKAWCVCFIKPLAFWWLSNMWIGTRVPQGKENNYNNSNNNRDNNDGFFESALLYCSDCIMLQDAVISSLSSRGRKLLWRHFKGIWLVWCRVKGLGGSKIGQLNVTSFIDDPQHRYHHWCYHQFPLEHFGRGFLIGILQIWTCTKDQHPHHQCHHH